MPGAGVPRAKVAVLRMLGRRGYLAHSEALSEWGMAGQYLWGWWTPYVGGGAWPLGFSRSWEYSPKASSGPQRSHAFSEAIPLQTVIFQGMCYWGTGHNGPPGFAILHGCRPNEGGSQGISDNAYFYFPWLVLWKTVSPHGCHRAMCLLLIWGWQCWHRRTFAKIPI